MKGDFSKLNFSDRNNNFNSVLHQQGRVLLDSDWNAQTQILNDWQTNAGQDIIGVGIAAVPAENPDAFKVIQAEVTSSSDRVELQIQPGRIWADGFLINLEGTDPLTRQATYLQPPIQNPPGTVDAIAEGVRDAVILEVWQEAFNGFQKPETLIEPALGGPDTTEREQIAMAWRLYRLADDENCDNIRAQLQDKWEQKGKLTVSLEEPTVTNGDCPVVAAGGYTGFEHYLYRVEIAQTTSATPQFKWSQFNGGLVGRGVFQAPSGGEKGKVAITHNLQAIIHSGIRDFYLEVIEYDAALGNQQVIYGAKASLNNSNELELAITTIFGTQPVSPVPLPGELPETYFFRLWNGIEDIATFAVNPAQPLQDGILLQFEDPTSSGKSYNPGDYWTFKVRAGEIPNVSPLVDNQPPEGIVYHRVAIAELNWNAAKDISFANQEIEDCRKPFRPLTNQKVCCTFSVGDGKRTSGDFNSITDAIRHLPPAGGKICLLPGFHEASVRLEGKRNIKIEGCGKQTRVTPGNNNRESPIFHIIDSECIALLDMDLATLGGTAIVLEGTEVGTLKEIEIGYNRILAGKEAIHIKQGVEITIHHNKIRMLDKEGVGVAIYLMAEDSLIERNDIGVIPAENTPPPDRPEGETPDPIDPCADLESVYTYIPGLIAYINLIWTIPFFIPTNPFKALGGIQITGGSERIKVWENKINGGAGNGIALGTSIAAFLAELEAEIPQEEEQLIEHDGGDLWGRVVLGETWIQGIVVLFESQDGTTFSSSTDNNGYILIRDVAAGEYSVAIATPGYKIERITFLEDPLGEFSRYQIEVVEEEIDLGDLLAFIYDIEIDRNEISYMGLSGIGLPRVEISDDLSQSAIARLVRIFAQFLKLFGNPIIDLRIHDNQIFNCFQNPINEVLRNEVKVKGFGGISLGLCANLSINRNRIEANGTSHITPVCGIFVTYGEQMDISHNWITENGELTNTTDALISGRRGGIVLGASSLPLLSLLSTGLNTTNDVTNGSTLVGRPATRVHDNIVSQPAGQALTILAIGPVSVVNNHFNSELSGTEFFDLLAGAVLIVNLGGLNRLGTPGIAGAIASTGAITDSPTTYNPFAQNPTTNLLFPNGNTLFNNNQTRLGIQNRSLTSQWIFSLDDVGFDGNQSDDLGGFRLSDQVIMAVNTVLWATTLRASDNRFKEILDVGQSSFLRISLYTLSILMNNTTNNQGDHCIFARNAFTLPAGPPLVTDGNQVLDARFCREFFQRSEG